jgi:hypothetical protein
VPAGVVAVVTMAAHLVKRNGLPHVRATVSRLHLAWSLSAPEDGRLTAFDRRCCSPSLGRCVICFASGPRRLVVPASAASAGVDHGAVLGVVLVLREVDGCAVAAFTARRPGEQRLGLVVPAGVVHRGLLVAHATSNP